MKKSRAQVFLLVALGCGFLVLGWRVLLEDSRNDALTPRAKGLLADSESADVDPGLNSDAGTVALAGVESTDGLRTEPPGNQLGNPDTSWLPPFEEFEVLDRTAEYVLESYWGAKWPQLENLLRKSKGDDAFELSLVQFQVSSEHRALFEPYGLVKLSGRDEFMRKLRDWFIADFDHRFIATYPYAQSVMVVASVSFAPTEGYDARRIISAALRVARERGAESSHLESPAATFKFEMDLFKQRGDSIADLLAELDVAASTLNTALRAALDKDLREIDEDSLPRIGRLFVGPLMGVSLHHADGLDSVAQRYVFSLAAGHHLDMEVGARARLVNHWGAQYSADMRDFASVQSALSHAEEEQARVSNAIYEIILAEIERAG
jgi:hypothetical protein